MSDTYKVDDWKVREAIYKVFGGKCFYTGKAITKEDMVIDHVVPKSKGGEDSIYNYVPTTKDINSKKSDRLDSDGVRPVLYLIKTVYAPKVFRHIKKLTPKQEGIGGTRTTIYIPNDVLEEMKEAAWEQHKSLSAYLVGLHTGDKVERMVLERQRADEIINKSVGLNRICPVSDVEVSVKKIEGLISERQKAFKDGNIAKAKKFNEALSESGVKVKDGDSGTSYVIEKVEGRFFNPQPKGGKK